MAECAIIVEVIVGELRLAEGSSLSHRAKDPLCPVVGVQISNGPLLYIPFLTPENIKNHVQHITKGHQFLPLEVEESYLNNGKFVFQKGKSCLYSVPPHSSSEISGEEEVQSLFQNLLKSSQNVVVTVLNSLHFPPSFFGKCNVELSIDNKSEGSMKGKLQLKNHNGRLTGYLTIAIMLKILGENIAPHKKEINHKMTLGTYSNALHEYIGNHSKQGSDIWTGEVTDEMSKIYKNISLLNQEDGRSKYIGIVNHPGEVKHSYELSRYADELLHDKESYCETSEEIAFKIAELVKSDKDSQENLIYPVSSNRALPSGLYQPSPILFSGLDSESERMWNKKMQKMGGFLNYAGFFDTQNERKWNQNTKTVWEGSIDASGEEDFSFDDLSNSSDMSDLGSPMVSVSDSSRTKLNKTKRNQMLETPKGWLRSTPVASCSIYKTDVYPKLTRTSLLRRAKWDPQLEKQLKAEVNHQVMLKLKLMDKKFREELLNVKRRRQFRNKVSDKISVGCQVDDCQGRGAFENIKNTHSDFSQQTNILSTVNQCTQAEEEARKDHKLQKYLTYDIDTTERTQSHLRKYEDDFEDSSTSVPNESCKVSEDVHHNRQHASYNKDPSAMKSLSVVESEPKRQNKDSKATNRMRESKMKVVSNNKQISDSDSSLAKSASKSKLSEKSSVQKGHIDMDKSSSASDTDFMSAKNSLASPEDNVANVKSVQDIVSSDADEVSEASDISQEVFQEILKGKQADILLRNGSQIQDVVMSDSSVAEEVNSLSKSSNSVPEDCKDNLDSRNGRNLSRKFGETFSIGEILPPDPDVDYSRGESRGEISSDSKIGSVQSAHRESADGHIQDSILYSKPPTTSPRAPVKLQEQRKHPLNMTYVISPRGSEDVDSSISNISARIAALLIPKNLQVASLHTDSISSYMPSNVSDTLSSLSDME